MKKNTFPALIITLILCFGITSCKKTNNSDNSSNLSGVQDVGLSDSDLLLWQSIGVDTVTKAADLTFDDGTSILSWARINDSAFASQYRKTTFTSAFSLQYLIAESVLAAYYLTDRIANPCPNQYGIAYVWGSKKYDNPSSCSPLGHKTGVSCACNNPQYGIDCSGLIYQIFNAKCHLSFGSADGSNVNTTYIQNVSNWTAALDASIWKGLIVIDSPKLPPAKFKAGDIIVNAPYHVGFVVNGKDGNKKIINSFGSYSQTCETNSDIYHGPIISGHEGLALDPQTVSDLFHRDYHILRFTYSLDGTWVRQNDGPSPGTAGMVVVFSNGQGVVQSVPNNSECFKVGDVKWQNYDPFVLTMDDLSSGCSGTDTYSGTTIDFFQANYITIDGSISYKRQ